MKNSIVAGAVATEFVQTLPPQFRTHSASIECGRFTYAPWVRMSTRKGSPSCVLSVVLSPPPRYDQNAPARNWSLSKRLRKSDPATLYRHLADMCETLRQRRDDLLIQLRERVFDLSETRQYDVDALPREATPFEEMSEEECHFWLDWLAQQPLRA